MDRQTDYVLVGARRAVGVPASPAQHIPGGPRGELLPLQWEEAGSLLPTPRKSGFDFSQPPKPSAPGPGARLHKPPRPGAGTRAGTPSLPPLSLLLTPCPCNAAGHGHPDAPAAAPAPCQRQGGGTRWGHKFPEQTIPASPGNGVRCFPAQPWPPPPPPPAANPKQTQHGRGTEHPARLAGGHRGTRGPHRQLDRGGERLAGVQFLLCPAFYRPFPPHRSIARQRGATLWLLTAHCFRATARGHLSGLKSHQCLAPGIFPSPRVEGAPCPSPLL